MVLLRQLFDIAGGGPETDAFKHLAASFTVLRSLGSAKTASNSESSRIVRSFRLIKKKIEVQSSQIL
jgi:dachs protein